MVAAALLASQNGHSSHSHHQQNQDQNQVDNNTTPSLSTHVQHTDRDIGVNGEPTSGLAPALGPGPGPGLVLEDVDDLSDIYDYMQERSHAQTQGLAQKHSFNHHNSDNNNHNSDNDDNNDSHSGRGERVKPKHQRSRRLGFDN